MGVRANTNGDRLGSLNRTTEGAKGLFRRGKDAVGRPREREREREREKRERGDFCQEPSAMKRTRDRGMHQNIFCCLWPILPHKHGMEFFNVDPDKLMVL